MNNSMKAITRLLDTRLLKSLGRMDEIYREYTLPCYVLNDVPEPSSIGEEATWLDTRKSIRWKTPPV